MPANTLLIDDEVNLVQSIKAAFDIRGLDLDTALSWDDGLQLFRVGLHDLVIADYNLPGSKLGLKLLARIKQLHPSSKLILISGYFDASAEELLPQTNLVDRFLP